MSHSRLFIGIMSGSSLDGIDVALVSLNDTQCNLKATYFQAYPEPLKQDLLKLHSPSDNELATASIIANTLAIQYADAVKGLLAQQQLSAKDITAIGCHGQTVRHQPKLHEAVGYSIQLGNHALLTELTGITVVGDFRARDIAADGEGAHWYPPFTKPLFLARTAIALFSILAALLILATYLATVQSLALILGQAIS